MKVKINTHGNALPEVHGEWIDLCTAEDVTLDFLEYKIISLGVSIEIPAGYYAHVVPRSSTFGKWGILLANSMGVIENDYCGDGDVGAIRRCACGKRERAFRKGTRICQFRLVEKAPDMEFVQVESLGNRDRGGFGSTGEQVHTGGTAERNKPERNSRVERMFGEQGELGHGGGRQDAGAIQGLSAGGVRGVRRDQGVLREAGNLQLSGVRSAGMKRRWRACAPCSCTVSAVSRSATRPMRGRRPSPIAAWTARHPWIWS